MALPYASEARSFFQSAKQRLEDGQFLFNGGRNTGAVYLAGYAVECILKALILSALPAKARTQMLLSFRGQKAHDYEWLILKYRESKGAALPRDVERDFVRVNSWNTTLRYKPGTIRAKYAREFQNATESLVAWGEGRLG
jgi:HEPN domain-containing protein